MMVHFNLEKFNLMSTRRKDHLITLILPIPFIMKELKVAKLMEKIAQIFPTRK
tara:strand:- start:861 stop:1019 length:159 start_codon:yes stop_codon:yes gene_type:complete